MAEGESRSEIRLENMGMIKLPSVLQDFKKITLISLKGNRISDVRASASAVVPCCRKHASHRESNHRYISGSSRTHGAPQAQDA